MSFAPERSQLCGLSYEVAECYGKPHINAYYLASGVKSHRAEPDALCAVCRKPAESVHHIPPLSKGRIFLLKTKWGQFVLKPSLFALCGSGTTGCHNGFHGGARYRATWAWDSDEYAEMWWSGEFLKDMRPHSPGLYAYGKWVIHDRRTGKDFEYRGEEDTWQAHR